MSKAVKLSQVNNVIIPKTAMERFHITSQIGNLLRLGKPSARFGVSSVVDPALQAQTSRPPQKPRRPMLILGDQALQTPFHRSI